MSGAQVSSFPAQNILYDMATGQTALTLQHTQNQLLQQQQDISSHEIEMGARLAGTLLSQYNTPEERAAAYPQHLAQARQQAPGYFKNAPATYPGDAATTALSRMGTPSTDLYKQGQAGAAASDFATRWGTTQATPPAGGTAGGGGSYAGGADTAPINAAGDSRTRKAAEGGPPADGTPGAAAAQQVHDFWISKGYNERQVAGIMAGGPGSESNFIPTVFGDNNTSYGAYQHHGPRLRNPQGTGLFDRYGPNPTLAQQNEYAAWEISPQGPLAKVGEMLKTATTPAEAATIWTQFFGVPADKTEIGRRARGADRYLGRYAGQPGAPGGATAPGMVTGDASRPDLAPPPPGGTPGAYPAMGGGIGNVLGPARENVGGQQYGVAPPPVIRAAPIPGTPMPPAGGRVAGDVDAMLGGMQLAQATPTPGAVLAAGPAAGPSGGAPAAPPAQPTPQAGWGSAVGNYGDGPATVAAPLAQPAQPPLPAQTAQQQPQAQPQTLPQVTIPPPRPIVAHDLTADQLAEIPVLRRQVQLGQITAADADKRLLDYQTANRAEQTQYALHVQAQQKEAQVEADRLERIRLAQITSQREQEAAVRQTQAAADAHAKAEREAADAAKLQLSKSDEADAERVLFAVGPKVRAAIAGTGPPLTPEEEDQYDVARRRYARGPVQQVPDGKGGTITAFVGQEVPDRFPPLPGQKEYAGLKPIPGTERQPDFAPANATTAMLDIGEAQRKIMRTLRGLEKYPGGVGLVSGGLPPIMSNWTNPQGIELRADVGDVKSHVYHQLSGAAVTATEEPKLKRFTPQETDTPEALKTKLQRMLDLNRETQLDHYRAFGPEAGGRRNPAVEDAILATIPQAALDHLKENPKTTKEFDQMYGRGAARLALSNG